MVDFLKKVDGDYLLKTDADKLKLVEQADENLSIDVYDKIGVKENIGATEDGLNIDVNEKIGISEFSTIGQDLEIVVYDNIAIQEHIALDGLKLKLRFTHVGIEILRIGDPKTRITHVGIEVLKQQVRPDVRITHIAIEVLKSRGGEAKGNFFLCF